MGPVDFTLKCYHIYLKKTLGFPSDAVKTWILYQSHMENKLYFAFLCLGELILIYPKETIMISGLRLISNKVDGVLIYVNFLPTIQRSL